MIAATIHSMDHVDGAPLLSILVPAYNAAPFIADCLRHIVTQMAPQHELIIVDDGSTDATPARVREVQAAHPQLRIALVQQANQGISAARNRALGEARGDYILFVDSDDRLLPQSLAELEKVMQAQRPDVIATALRMWHPDAPSKDRDVAMHYPPGQLITGQDQILLPFFADRHMYVWCKVFRREIYARPALPAPLFPVGRLFEDVAVVPRLLRECASLVYIPHVLLAYRQHPVSITRVISERWCIDFITALASVKPGYERRRDSDRVRGDGGQDSGGGIVGGAVSAAVRSEFDAAVCHFYIGIVKNSYQLPSAAGKRVRAQVREIFLSSLFNPPQQALDELRARGALRTARQVGRALAGSKLFHVQQSVLRTIKLWQRMARTRSLRAG